MIDPTREQADDCKCWFCLIGHNPDCIVELNERLARLQRTVQLVGGILGSIVATAAALLGFF